MKQYIEDLYASGVLHDDILFIDFEFVDSQTIMSEGTKVRKIRSLERPWDNYPKIILILDRYGPGDENGIKTVSVLDWFMSE